MPDQAVLPRSPEPAPHLIAHLQAQARLIRADIIRMVHTARSGHPGGSLSAADIVTALYFHVLRLDPANPAWPERDRFILSKGHACPVLYACLARRGFFPLSALGTLRQINGILQGHPALVKTPGLDTTAGSLGNGLSLGIGMALGLRLDRSPARVYVILGDGELDEGMIWEAALAGNKWRLANLTAIVDYNGLQLDGTTEQVMPLEPLAAKWQAFGWRTVEIDGHDMTAILAALAEAKSAGAPTVIIAHTVKGKGVSFMENQADWHGRAPNEAELEQALTEIEHG